MRWWWVEWSAVLLVASGCQSSQPLVVRPDGYGTTIIPGSVAAVQVCKDGSTCNVIDGTSAQPNPIVQGLGSIFTSISQLIHPGEGYVSALCNTPYGSCRVPGAHENTPCSCKSLDGPPIRGTVIREFAVKSTPSQEAPAQAETPPSQEEQTQKVRLLKQMIALAEANGGLEHTSEINNLKQQIEALPKPAKGNRRLARPMNDMGLALVKEEKYEDAKQHFINARKNDPSDAEIVGNLGYAALESGDYKQAIISFTEALELMPSRSPTWENLAEYYALKGQQQKAVACFALAFHFSRDKNIIRNALQTEASSNENSNIRQAAQQALKLSLINGE